MAGRDRRRDSDAIRITSAGVSRSEDAGARQRRYLMSMALRTLCVVGAVVVGPGWLRWVLVAGAIVLPWVAVVAANVVDRRDQHDPLPDAGLVTRQLPSAVPPGDGRSH